jgi:hypothetical protein
MALKAIKPEVIQQSKPKFMISGRSGVGKTMFALSWPAPYLIDVEGGAIRPQYRKFLTESKGAYFGKEQGSQNFDSVIEEIKSLATTKHGYKSLIIDSFSALYGMAAAIAEEKVGSSFGRDKKEANRPTRQLMRWLEECDMNILLICHSKDKWERKGSDIINIGTTFDGYDKLEYILDLWCEIVKRGDKRTYVVKKSRIESFREGMEFPLDYKAFAELYGEDVIDKPSQPLTMITKGQEEEIMRLLDVVKIDEDTVQKWFEKASVDKWSELTSEHADKILKFLRTKIEGIKGDSK